MLYSQRPPQCMMIVLFVVQLALPAPSRVTEKDAKWQLTVRQEPPYGPVQWLQVRLDFLKTYEICSCKEIRDLTARVFWALSGWADTHDQEERG